jgi:hypothetical protein
MPQVRTKLPDDYWDSVYEDIYDSPNDCYRDCYDVVYDSCTWNDVDADGMPLRNSLVRAGFWNGVVAVASY